MLLSGISKILVSFTRRGRCKHGRCGVDLPDLPLPVDADATRIAQVVANLLNNAAKYTPARGRIRLSVRREDLDAVVAVSDTGVGIAGDALAGAWSRCMAAPV